MSLPRTQGQHYMPLMSPPIMQGQPRLTSPPIMQGQPRLMSPPQHYNPPGHAQGMPGFPQPQYPRPPILPHGPPLFIAPNPQRQPQGLSSQSSQKGNVKR